MLRKAELLPIISKLELPFRASENQNQKISRNRAFWKFLELSFFYWTFLYKKVQQSLQVKNIPFIHSRTSAPGVIKVLSWHQRPVLCLYQSPKAHDKIVRPFHKSHVLRKFMNTLTVYHWLFSLSANKPLI